jgi:hypothetical protein
MTGNSYSESSILAKALILGLLSSAWSACIAKKHSL